MKSLRFWKMTALAVAAVMMVACSSSRNLEKSKDEAAMEAVAAAQLADSLQRAEGKRQCSACPFHYV